MGLIAGIDVGTTSAAVVIDEDTLEVVSARSVTYARDGQLWEAHDTTMDLARFIRDSGRATGAEVIAVMVEQAFMGRGVAASMSVQRKQGWLELAAIRCLGPVLADARTAVQLRRQVGLPNRKAEAHAALLARYPDAEPLDEHQRDAFVAALAMADLIEREPLEIGASERP